MKPKVRKYIGKKLDLFYEGSEGSRRDRALELVCRSRDVRLEEQHRDLVDLAVEVSAIDQATLTSLELIAAKFNERDLADDEYDADVAEVKKRLNDHGRKLSNHITATRSSAEFQSASLNSTNRRVDQIHREIDLLSDESRRQLENLIEHNKRLDMLSEVHNKLDEVVSHHTVTLDDLWASLRSIDELIAGNVGNSVKHSGDLVDFGEKLITSAQATDRNFTEVNRWVEEFMDHVRTHFAEFDEHLEALEWRFSAAAELGAEQRADMSERINGVVNANEKLGTWLDERLNAIEKTLADHAFGKIMAWTEGDASGGSDSEDPEDYPLIWEQNADGYQRVRVRNDEATLRHYGLSEHAVSSCDGDCGNEWCSVANAKMAAEQTAAIEAMKRDFSKGTTPNENPYVHIADPSTDPVADVEDSYAPYDMTMSESSYTREDDDSDPFLFNEIH